MAAEWIWYGWESQSKILLAVWMESVTITILETLSIEHAWLRPHLIAKSSASVLVTKEAWWTVLTIGRLNECICEIDVAMSFLMLVSVTMRAERGSEEQQRTILSSSWLRSLFWFSSLLLTKLKEKRLENLSTMWWPGENSGSRGEKDGNIPWDLIFESTICPLVKDLWRLVKEPILWELFDFDWGGSSKFI